MRILVTNDDGIQSGGVKTLAELLSKKGHKVTVVAPDGNRSAFSNVANKDFDFKKNAEAIDEIFDKLVKISDGGYVLNVNLPNGKHKGVKIVPLGVQEYTDEYQKNDDGTYMLTGYPICLEKGEYCDVEFSNKKYITVTPIMYDRTAKDIVNKYKDMEF